MFDRRHAAFGRDALRSLWLCGSLHNWGLFGILAFFLSLPYLAAWLPIFGAFVTLVSLIVGLLTAGLFAAYFLEIIPATAAGEDELPDYPDLAHPQDAIAEPLVSLLWTVGILIAPWIAWRLLTPHLDVSDATASTLAWILGLLGFGLIPIGFVATAWGGVGMVFRVDLLVRAVWRTPLEYLALLAILATALTIGVMLFQARVPAKLTPDWLLDVIAGEDFHARYVREWRVLHFPLLAECVFLYTAIMLARLIGLYQRHFGDRLPWA